MAQKYFLTGEASDKESIDIVMGKKKGIDTTKILVEILKEHVYVTQITTITILYDTQI